MKKGFSVKLMVSTFIFTFACLSAMLAFASNQPPEGAKIKGPAIIAEITFINNSNGYLVFYGTGSCQGSPIVFDESTDTSHSLSDVTEQSILDNFINFPAGLPYDLDGDPAECIPEGAYGLVARAVTDFQDEGTYKWARIILLFAY